MTRIRFRTLGLALIATAATLSMAQAAPRRLATEVGGEVAPGTVWRLAQSPFATTAAVTVPPGVTLTVEAGVVVRLGAAHDIVVAGALRAVGSEASPIRFERVPDGMHWGTVTLAAGSGPTEIAHAVLEGGGARRRPLLAIATDAALIRDTLFTRSQGLGVEVRDGASPALRGCTFDQASDGSANPPAALRLLGPSDAVITDNYFQSNFQAVNWQADANPTFTGNRFDYNGLNGVVVGDTVRRSVRWPNLGPRDWAYYLLGTGVTVAPTGTLTIDPGSTVRMFTGAGIRVDGTLRARGTATAKILFTTQSQDPKPGQWPEISFMGTSVGHDAQTDQGSVLEHAVLEYGGSSTGRALFIRDSSPRVANTVVRYSGARGIVVTGSQAQPTLVGLLIAHNRADPDGVGLTVSVGAAPDVSFTILRENHVGLRTESDPGGRYGPHNRFDRNLMFGAINADSNTCINAAGNDWSAPNGPQDLSAQPDACGLAENMGDGDMVSDDINYLPFEGQLPIPALRQPSCGSTSDTRPLIAGLAPPRSEVVVYDNQRELGRVRTDEGQEGIGRYAFTPPPLAPGSHVLQVQTVDGELASAVSDPVDVYVDPELWVDPAHILVRYDLDGTRYVQPYFHYVGDRGCRALRDDNGWQVRPHPGAPLTLEARIACPGGEAPAAALAYRGETLPMSAVGDDRQAVTFDMAAGGAFDVRATCAGTERAFRLGNIVTEYEGFVYDAVRGVLERVRGARITLLQYDPDINNFAVWRGAEFFGQTNPQIAGPAGWYGFYPPPGRYRVLVDAEGYHRFISSDVTVLEQPVMLTIALQPKSASVYLPVARVRR